MVGLGADDIFASSFGVSLVDNCEPAASSDQPPPMVSGTLYRLPKKQKGINTVCYLASVEPGRENVASSAGSETRVRNIRLINAMVSSTPIE